MCDCGQHGKLESSEKVTSVTYLFSITTMFRRRAVHLLLLTVLAAEINNVLSASKKQDVSTSSDSDDRSEKSEGARDRWSSMQMSLSNSDETPKKHDKQKKKSDVPKSSKERTGWRKWHRKCTPCPADDAKVWRDPSIRWICGHYQRARRSFKSLCSMRLRNCQDGTMFVFMHDGRCANDTGKEERGWGEHFFYDYRAALSEDSNDSDSDSDDESDSDSPYYKSEKSDSETAV